MGVGVAKEKRSNDALQKQTFLYYEQIIRICISIVFLITAFFVPKYFSLVLFICSAIIVGYELIYNFVKNAISLKFFDENTLMLIASITAFVLGEYFEGALIVLLFYIGEFLEKIATDNSRRKIAGLSELKSTLVHYVDKDGVKDLSPDQIKVGSLIEIKSGEMVPIDGVLIGLPCDFDMKAITGESKLVTVENGDKVYSGAINVGNPVLIRTIKEYKDSTVESIISMVEGSLSKKSKSQKFISKFAKIYTPIIFCLAMLIAVVPPLFEQMNFIKWIYKALSFLVISCPCALVISVPLSFFVGIGGLAKHGVLIKGSVYLENLTKAKTVVFDKTGTLTYGNFCVEKIDCYNNFTAEQILSYAVGLERHSNHPIAKAFYCYKTIKGQVFENVKEIAGKGLQGVCNGIFVVLGNEKFMLEQNIEVYDEYAGTILYLAINNGLVGKIYINDQIKSNARIAIDKLNKIGITETVMLSGDNEIVAKAVAKEVGIKNAYYKLFPNEKVEKLKWIKNNSGGETIYVGDGINDSPSLALADVGIAMGGLGSEIATSSADMVIMDDNLEKIYTSIRHAKKVKRAVLQNIIGSLGVKFAIMLLSVVVLLPVWVAMLSDVGVMLLAILNSLKVAKVKS